MSYKVIISVAVGTAMLLSGCHEKNEGIVAEHVISMDVDALLKEEVSIFDMFSDVDVVSLDNTYPLYNHVYLGPSNIACDGERIYILGWRDGSIHVHNMDGSLALCVSRRGRGPGEYLIADQINYNEELDLIEVLDATCRILRYTTDSLRFVSELDFSDQGLRAMHNFYQRGDRYITHSSSEEDHLWELDSKTCQLHSYRYNPPEHLLRYNTPQAPFFEFMGKPCFFRTEDGLVWTFDADKCRLEPYIAWDFGKYSCRGEEIPEDKDVEWYHDFIFEYSKHRISPFMEIKASGSRLFAEVAHNGKLHTVYHDLETGESLLFEKTVEGMSFLPELFRDGVMYKFIDYTFLPEYVNREILDPVSQAAYDKVLAEEGAAIVRYRLK
ncbi:MAG TPA: 6-bladed beta-propeller [Candidatus Cryptobacteroides merdipullorum]|uniref:6-bladed beta-propeller n=1 Tax=Candidatus Cryptobacteroides merdipullorum TaxID=2840771 RepID=A0A9D1GLH4_9BACT|nr:6-bladed beta-propeller [Candidatus Cryptobacteroides merdipullorum]